ncbi:MAG: di-heme oxidoredictase family protein [Fimbriimonadaceae bacterium]
MSRIVRKVLLALAVSPAIIAAGQLATREPGIRVHPSHTPGSRGARLQGVVADGRSLFVTKFTVHDGAGRPSATGDSKPTFREPIPLGPLRVAGPDASACSSCHNDPVVGGSGDFVANVFVGAQFSDPPTRSTDVESTSERNTIGLFGSGAIELLAREMTEDLRGQLNQAVQRARMSKTDVRQALSSKGVRFGSITARPDGTYDGADIQGVDVDLVVKPFGSKGVVISLREFSINALNHHHGIQAVERFGPERTGLADFDSDGIAQEFTIGQVSALTLFQAGLPAPKVAPQEFEARRGRYASGLAAFKAVGCADCHVPALPLRSRTFVEPNPYNRPGNALPSDIGTVALELEVGTLPTGLYRATDGSTWVAAFSDLRRHVIADDGDPFFGNEVKKQDNVPVREFLTSKLWDAATSAPYGHRGDCTTVGEAVAHHAGEARASREAFLALPAARQQALVDFVTLLGGGHYGAKP